MAEANSPANLPDLPTELLLDILSLDNYSICPQDIYNVAFVSRRLRDLALPLFLEAEGVKDPEQETSLYLLHWSRKEFISAKESRVLSALSLSPSITHIKQFRCSFQDPETIQGHRNTFQSMHNLPDAVRRVSRFIEKLQGIDSAEIYLIWDRYNVIRTNENIDILSDFKQWTKAFGVMLNLLLERGCSSLRIQYDPSVLPAVRFRPSGSVQKIVSYLGMREEQSAHLRWEFLQPSRVHGVEQASYSEINQAASISPSAKRKQQITSLSIHSPALLLPPFINWTISLLRTHANLTSISFACIAFDEGIWANVLHAIAEVASTQITELRFFQNCPHLEAHNLLQFIGQLPNLTHLSIDRTFRTRFQNFTPSSLNLCSAHSISSSYSLPRYLRMVTLKAPVEVVSLLLGPRQSLMKAISPFPLRNLETLTVYPSSFLVCPFSYIKSILNINELLKGLKRLPSCNSLLLSLDAQWRLADLRSIAHYFQNINTSAEFQRTLREELTAEEIQKLTEMIPHIAYNHISHVTLYNFHPQKNDQIPTSLCLWLKTLFPHAERLTLTCRRDADPILKDVEMDDETAQRIAKELKKVCPTIRILVVGERTYNLS